VVEAVVAGSLFLASPSSNTFEVDLGTIADAYLSAVFSRMSTGVLSARMFSFQVEERSTGIPE
jgi:hypothetical protein